MAGGNFTRTFAARKFPRGLCPRGNIWRLCRRTPAHESRQLHRLPSYKHCALYKVTRYEALRSRKTPSDGLRITKSLANIFQFRCLQSVSIFSIRNHPCSFMVYIYVWNYKNGTEEFESYHPHFTLIAILLKAAFKPCKRREIEKGRQWIKRMINEWRKNKKGVWTDFPLNFYIVTRCPEIVSGERKTCSLAPFSKIQTCMYYLLSVFLSY